VSVFAHAGHWLVSIAYASPVVGLLVWLAIVKIRDMRSQRQK